MNSEPHPFTPDWTLHPCVTLNEILEDRSLTATDLVRLTGLPAETVAGILAGTAPIGGPAAERLETALAGPPAAFWLKYQVTYESDLARGARDCTKDDLEN